MKITIQDLEKATQALGLATVEENGNLFILQKEKNLITTLRIEEGKKRILIRSHLQGFQAGEQLRSAVVEFFNILNGHADLYASFFVDNAGACWITGLVSLRGTGAFESAQLAPVLLSCIRGAERLRDVFDQFPAQTFDVISAAELFFSPGHLISDV